MAKTNPLVRNTILATTASHLRHLSPNTKEYQVSEHYHKSLVIQNLREALATPQELLGQDGAKALLMSAILLNMISFAISEHESEDPETSWVFSTKEDRVNWLALQTGLRSILQSLTVYIEDVVEFLGPIFLGGGKESWDFKNMQQDLTGIPQSWINIFQLQNSSMGEGCDPASTDYNDMYRLAIIQLSIIRKVECIRSNTFRCLQFLSKIPPSFRALLHHRDERALWLFGYWLGLMCRFKDVWWFRKRVVRDHKAIVLWLKRLHLEQLPGTKGDDWREMMLDLELAPTYRSL
ncbi:hypothetical protein H2198_001333 [Neophaeococcomyces mojaviensis]|uniref:Uncharacterized protein n=1 Tax=Neophaeococcomyces mojaviensis TaxID=3383035 RepID=A0ACC3AHD0_9EURO|nr:hypothetical protein H2198_001333 [Knufia sp. JES_112]